MSSDTTLPQAQTPNGGDAPIPMVWLVWQWRGDCTQDVVSVCSTEALADVEMALWRQKPGFREAGYQFHSEQYRVKMS